MNMQETRQAIRSPHLLLVFCENMFSRFTKTVEKSTLFILCVPYLIYYLLSIKCFLFLLNLPLKKVFKIEVYSQ